MDGAELDFLRENIATILDKEVDRRSLHAHVDGARRLDRSLWDLAAELGWLGVGLAEEHGGLGYGVAGLDLLFRELGRVAAPGPFLASLAAAQTLQRTADAAIRDEWLPRLASGELRLAVPVDIASAPRGPRRLLDAEGAAAALAPVDDETWGLFPLADVELEPTNMWDRTRGIAKADLARVAPAATLPGARTAAALAHHLALAVAADSVGGARAILDQTVSYMKQREQFGRPIAAFQALKHRVADLATLVLGAEEIVAQAVEAAGAEDEDAAMWAAFAKVLATERYAAVAGESLQLHGGIAVTWEYDVHIFLKRARLSETLIGSNTFLLDRAVAGLAGAMREGRSTMTLQMV